MRTVLAWGLFLGDLEPFEDYIGMGPLFGVYEAI